MNKRPSQKFTNIKLGHEFATFAAMLKILQSNFYLYKNAITVWVLFCATLAFVYLYFGKIEGFMLLNANRNSVLDSCMPYITHLGDYISVLLVVLFLIIKKNKQAAWLLLTNSILITVLVQGLKLLIFPDSLRPQGYLPQFGLNPQTAPNLVMYFNNSFPSGHTAQGFTLFFSAAWLLKSIQFQYICTIIACMIGYSRIYLGQHFVEDVLVSALFSVPINLLMYSIYEYYLKRPFKWKQAEK